MNGWRSVAYTLEYDSAIKKNEILSIMTMWMDLEDIMLSEMSDTERQIPYDFTYMWSLKNKNKQNRNRLIDAENNFGCQRGRGLGGRVKTGKDLKT